RQWLAGLGDDCRSRAGTLGKCSIAAWFGEQPVQSSSRLNSRHVAIAAQIQEIPIGVERSIVTIDQDAQRNAMKESRREQLCRRPGCIKGLFGYRVMCRFARGSELFSV